MAVKIDAKVATAPPPPPHPPWCIHTLIRDQARKTQRDQCGLQLQEHL